MSDAIQSNLCVKLMLPNYALALTDNVETIEINGVPYVGLGKLLSITPSTSELRISGNELSITLSGVPESQITSIIDEKVKGSKVQIYRRMVRLNYPNTVTIFNRYNGVISSMAFDEEYDNTTMTSTNTIIFNCSSIVDILDNRIAGRKTNPQSEKTFFPNDLSMDKVPTLQYKKFNFGASKK